LAREAAPSEIKCFSAGLLAIMWFALIGIAVVVALLGIQFVLRAPGSFSMMSVMTVFIRYRNEDLRSFLKRHREALQHGAQTGDYVAGVCNYYTLMSQIITIGVGPFWHFTPAWSGLTYKQCHEKFHHTMTRLLGAKSSDHILEYGCGYGECGRQVSKIAGSKVTGLTMSDVEIVGGNERINDAGLQDRCTIKQGNYHDMPFAPDTFDKVFGIYCLKYSSDLETAMSECARVLKPGGRLVSYEIIVTDKYDEDNKLHKQYVDNICHSTCMPPLWSATAFRLAAKKAGLVLKEETDLGTPADGTWYSRFETTGIFWVLTQPITIKLVRLAEALRILGPSFTEFYDNHFVHPAVDFVRAGRLGIVTGSVAMVWEKPKPA